MKLKRKIIVLIGLFVLLGNPQQVTAQAPAPAGTNAFYLGAHLGSPLFWGDMFSLGNETRLSYGGGLFAGHTIGGWFSPEISFDYGIGRLGVKEDQLNDYVNKQGIIKYEQYNPADVKLGDLYSKTSYMQVGLRLQVGFVNLLRPDKASGFDIDIAPAIYLQKFTPEIRTINGDIKLDGFGITDQKWNYAVGGDVGLRFRLAPKASMFVRSGLLWLRNEAFEGVNNDPVWRVNLMVNSTLGVSINLNQESGQKRMEVK